MNVTFMIGNGFDINLGLKTKYSDFLKHYAKNIKEDTDQIREFKNEINGAFEDWVNFEENLGKYTENYEPCGGKPTHVFFQNYRDLRNNLVQYLQAEETKAAALFERIDSAKDDYDYDHAIIPCQKFFSDISFFTKYISTNYQKGLNPLFFNMDGYRVECKYNILDFNYTRAVDWFFSHFQNGFVPRRDKLGDIIHVHGDLGGPIIFGVNDGSQVVNEVLRKNEEFMCNFIKPIANDALENEHDTAGKAIIGGSDIVIIFGMSLGKTDATWWNALIDWLGSNSANTERYVVVFYFDGERDKHEPYHVTTTRDEIQEKLLSYYQAELSAEKRNNISNHIIVELNAELFSSLHNWVFL